MLYFCLFQFQVSQVSQVTEMCNSPRIVSIALIFVFNTAVPKPLMRCHGKDEKKWFSEFLMSICNLNFDTDELIEPYGTTSTYTLRTPQLTTKVEKCALWAITFCIQMSSFGNSTWRDYKCLGNKKQICFCWAANPIIINAPMETRGKKMRRHFLMIAQNFVQNQTPILDPQWLGTLQHHSLSQQRGRSP